MEITTSTSNGRRPITVFHIKGEISSNNYQMLEQKAEEAYKGGTRDLLLDLKEVPFISSAGIRALNVIIRLLQTDAPEESDEAMLQGIRDGSFHSPHLKLVNVSRQVKEIFKIAGVDMLVEIHDDFNKAVNSF